MTLHPTQALALWLGAGSLVAGLFPALMALRLWLEERRALREKDWT